MKVNSNTVSLTKESSEYQAIEGIIKKIASENEIDSVESVRIALSAEEGLIGFKIAEEATEALEGSEDPQLKKEKVEEAVSTEMTESNR